MNLQPWQIKKIKEREQNSLNESFDLITKISNKVRDENCLPEQLSNPYNQLTYWIAILCILYAYFKIKAGGSNGEP